MRTSAFGLNKPGTLQSFLGLPVLVGRLVLHKSQSMNSCGLHKFI